MRKVDLIIVHCAATPEGRDVKTNTIRKWHTDPKPKGRGWEDIGYHYIIEVDGAAVVGRNITEIGAHAYGHNSNSIGICYVGGIDECGKPKDTRTQKQKEALWILIKYLKCLFPKAKIIGHNEVSNKACPSFNVQKDL